MIANISDNVYIIFIGSIIQKKGMQHYRGKNAVVLIYGDGNIFTCYFFQCILLDEIKCKIHHAPNSQCKCVISLPTLGFLASSQFVFTGNISIVVTEGIYSKTPFACEAPKCK